MVSSKCHPLLCYWVPGPGQGAVRTSLHLTRYSSGSKWHDCAHFTDQGAHFSEEDTEADELTCSKRQKELDFEKKVPFWCGVEREGGQ